MSSYLLRITNFTAELKVLVRCLVPGRRTKEPLLKFCIEVDFTLDEVPTLVGLLINKRAPALDLGYCLFGLLFLASSGGLIERF
jgi:hypothetical protein